MTYSPTPCTITFKRSDTFSHMSDSRRFLAFSGLTKRWRDSELPPSRTLLSLVATTSTFTSPHPLSCIAPSISPSMANYLASIFGTEQDKVNCSFYYKIGACRHGDRCSRKHVKPSYSQTILLPNLYQNPAYDPKNKMNPQQMQMHFDAFYEDIWCELCQYGLVEELVVCDNNNDRKFFPK